MVYPVMQYPTYILDVEEAVADLSGCYSEAFSASLSEFGIPYEAERSEEYIRTPLDVLFSSYYTGCTCKYRDFVTKFIGEFDRAFASGFSVRDGVAERSGDCTGRVQGCASCQIFSPDTWRRF